MTRHDGNLALLIGRHQTGESDMREPSVTAEQVKELFDYDPVTGNLNWRVSRSSRIRVGDLAGTLGANGRRYVLINGVSYLVHRVIWLMCHGEWPKGNISPRDGDYLNLRLSNLIERSPTETVLNAGIRSSNKTGVAGVTFSNKKNKWVAMITVDYKQRYLGAFDSLEEAKAARLAAETATTPSAGSDDRAAKAAALAMRSRQRAVWARMVDQFPDHLWPSMDAFIAEVGLPEKRNRKLVPIAADVPIGPGNFAWALPEIGDFDTRSTTGRNDYGKAYRNANPLLYREKELRKKFNIGLEQYEEMFKAQGGVCAICGQTETAVRGGKDLWLAVDHCHQTGALRGLLCSNCNRGIGCFGDDRERMSNAIRYIDKHAAASPENVVPFRKPEDTA
jgi:hypothetical protein